MKRKQGEMKSNKSDLVEGKWPHEKFPQQKSIFSERALRWEGVATHNAVKRKKVRETVKNERLTSGSFW